jgi:hypothetical protein
MLGLNLASLSGQVQFAIERWPAIAREATALGAQHFAEVERGLDPRRPYRLSDRLMTALDAVGYLVIATARVDDALVGYCSWQVAEDVESEGLLIAQQGAWFISPDYSDLHLGLPLLKFAIADLKARGVQFIFPHHRMQGRGRRLGLLFQRMGAVLTQATYMLRIGGD